jgi:hypothetical protein
MSKRGRRVRQPRGPHKDKYAAQAARSQSERVAFDTDWARNHPTPSATTEPAEETPEGGEESQ